MKIEATDFVALLQTQGTQEQQERVAPVMSSPVDKLPDYVRLVGYKTDSILNRLNDPPEEWQADRSQLSTVEPPLDHVQDATIHFFQIEADRRMFKVVVQGSRVFVIEV